MPADLPPNPPERRAIELVPLGDPVAEVTPLSRAYPYLVAEPVPPWPAPAIRTSRHLAAVLPASPETHDDPAADRDLPPAAPVTDAGPVVDLTVPLAVLDLTERPTEPPATPSAAQPTAERLRALLARERERIRAEIAEVTDPAHARPAGPATAPFPLPTDRPARRTPKALLPDAAGRPLAEDVAAAIARVTGAVPAPPARPTSGAGSARDRLEIVPLGPPALAAAPTEAPAPLALPAPPAPPVVAARAPAIDLRDPRPVRALAPAAPVRHPCPACGTKGVVDVIDQITGEIHVSCPQCFRMWRAKIDRPSPLDAR